MLETGVIARCGEIADFRSLPVYDQESPLPIVEEILARQEDNSPSPDPHVAYSSRALSDMLTSDPFYRGLCAKAVEERIKNGEPIEPKAIASLLSRAAVHIAYWELGKKNFIDEFNLDGPFAWRRFLDKIITENCESYFEHLSRRRTTTNIAARGVALPYILDHLYCGTEIDFADFGGGIMAAVSGKLIRQEPFDKVEDHTFDIHSTRHVIKDPINRSRFNRVNIRHGYSIDISRYHDPDAARWMVSCHTPGEVNRATQSKVAREIRAARNTKNLYLITADVTQLPFNKSVLEGKRRTPQVVYSSLIEYMLNPQEVDATEQSRQAIIDHEKGVSIRMEHASVESTETGDRLVKANDWGVVPYGLFLSGPLVGEGRILHVLNFSSTRCEKVWPARDYMDFLQLRGAGC